MSIAKVVRAHSYPATALGSPLSLISWKAAYWADDPSWSNPGDGGAVASWRDGSGNGATLTEATNKPTFRAADTNMNGRGSVEFNGSNNKLRGTFSSDSAQPRSIVVVARIRSLGTSTPVILDSDANVGKVCVFFWDTTDANKLSLFCGTAQTKYAAVTTGLHGFRVYVNGASSVVNLDGSTTSPGTNPGTQQLSGLTLGASRVTSLFSAITVGFVGVYQGDVTAATNWPKFVALIRGLYGVTVA